MYEINNYDDAHAKAYEILNRVTELLDDNYTIIQLIKWRWEKTPDHWQLCFVIEYRGFTFCVMKNDSDMFTKEWYHSAAETIAAWLLLQRGVSKTKSKAS